MIYNIIDDSGLIALVNVDKYNSFVDNDWELDQLLKHFKEEMENKNLLIWGTGTEGGTWKVEIKQGFSNLKGFRECVGTINSCYNAVYLVNYDSLTMAAQFEDVKLPEDYLADLEVPLDAGYYRCKVIQMFDPAKYISNEHSVDFIIEFEKANENEINWIEIPWFKL
jgi:hypothetical protein